MKHARVTLQTQLTLAVFKSRGKRPASAPDVSVHPDIRGYTENEGFTFVKAGGLKSERWDFKNRR